MLNVTQHSHLLVSQNGKDSGQTARVQLSRSRSGSFKQNGGASGAVAGGGDVYDLHILLPG